MMKLSLRGVMGKVEGRFGEEEGTYREIFERK
jgi:hypothetical protein